MHAPVHPSQSTRAEIDLRAFRNNLDIVRKVTGPDVRVMAVLKSNGYGHGVRRIAQECVRRGVDELAVARLGEGSELRAEGVDVPILVCEIVADDLAAQALYDDLHLTITSLAGARNIAQCARRAGRKARVHVKIDTGMGRLGFDWKQGAPAVEEVARLAGLELVGVFSHFAGSEDPTGQSARLQLDRFLGVLEELRRRGVEVPVRHMANSGAILSLPASHLDMVRPGLLLYGYTPRASMPGGEELLPVLSLKSRISYIKSVGPGTTISYGGKFVTNRATTIATVPIGYGDGYSRLLTHRSEVLIRGRRFPTVGSICMDHLMVDLGPDGGAEEGDDVTLIGRDGDECITCWEIARHMGSIPYEVTCLITPRVDRVFIE